MATLVLTAVGTIVGGPIGAAIGSFIGQAIDRQVFAPDAVKGPRLGDLSVQTSSYGTQVPRIYGTMRVAGTVIWAADLVEHSQTSGGGKSGPEVETFRYTVSFAVALSSRPTRAIKRIWADGKLLQGRRRDLKRRVKYRFYTGSEAQAVDPLIASIEGIDKTPAHRGTSYVVFEDLDLSPFGSRIPQLTFEIEADEGPVAVTDLLQDVSDGWIEAGHREAQVAGYSAHGTTRRAAVETLAELFAVKLLARDGGLVADPQDAAQTLPSAEARGCHAGARRDEDGERRRLVSAHDLPASLGMAYYDPERDYLAGMARASVDSGGRGEQRFEAAVVMGADEAKRLANQAMAARWAGRERWTVQLPPPFMGLEPGSRVTLPDDNGTWSVGAVAVEGLAVRAELRRVAPRVNAVAADAGRPVPAPDRPIGKNRLRLVDLPKFDGAASDEPSLWMAIGAEDFQPTTVKGWMNEVDVAETMVRRTAVTGRVTGALIANAPPWLRDERSAIEVQLDDPAEWLVSADALALGMGANLALIGDELVQFASVEAMGSGRFRLTSFWRGRAGTEWAMADAPADGDFLLVDVARMTPLPIRRTAIGATLSAEAYGMTDDPLDPATASVAVSGEALRPVAPPVEAVDALGDGSLRLRLRHRSRASWAWIDGQSSALASAMTGYATIGAEGVETAWTGDEIVVSADVAAMLPNPCPVTLTALDANGRSRPWRQTLSW